MVSIISYCIFLISVMIITSIIKNNHLADQLIIGLQKIPQPRIRILLISMVGGILPVPGRVLVSASILDQVAPAAGPERQKFGVLDYLGSHHYYLWSPLEKTVILPMAALGLSYSGFMSVVWPLVLISFLFITGYVFFGMKEPEIIQVRGSFNRIKFLKNLGPLFLGIILIAFGINPGYVFAVVALWYILQTRTSLYDLEINWSLVIVLVVVMFFGQWIKGYEGEIINWMHQSSSIYFATGLAFIASWLMGSSSKYAGIVAVLVTIYGPQYLILFLVVDFSAYNLSPIHKCTHIGRMYFNTPFWMYYKPIVLWMLLLGVYAVLVTSGVL